MLFEIYGSIRTTKRLKIAALARANVGIAMGTGTDVAMNSAHLNLVKGDLRGIATARELSIATVRNRTVTPLQ